jgi:RNA polymerase sigma factor (TIGR02999 family)
VPQQSERPEEAEPLRLTLLLNRLQHGDREAGQEALKLIYGELHRIASGQMRYERPGHTLQTTALINEAYVRLVGSGSLQIQNRQHFFAIASQQMRRILVDYARASKAPKRGGGAVKVDLDQVSIPMEEHGFNVLLVDQALEELERLDPRAARVVELKYFGGCTDPEAAQVLSVSVPTIRRDWDFARSWLRDWMNGDHNRRPQPRRGSPESG